jgi:Double-GTPase 2
MVAVRLPLWAMLPSQRNVRCPWCWAAFAPTELHQHCPETCGDAAQEFPSARLCPHGKEPTVARYCPRCAKRLEHDYITTPARIIAVVGSSESGKSTYIGVLINELRNRVGAAFDGMSVDLVGDASRARYDTVFRDYLYGQGRTLRRTDSARAVHVLEPLMFMLRLPRRRRFSGRERVTAGVAVFYDTAGEDILDADGRERLARYLTAADGIVFVIDPLQVRSVREAVDGLGSMPTQPHDQLGMLQGVAEVLRRGTGRGGAELIRTPLAVVVAKTDALTGLLPDGTALSRPGPHNGAYDEPDGRQVHDEVRSIVQRWTDGPALINMVQNTFAEHRFFGLSALGFPPPNRDELSTHGIHPLRVEDPMLWLLARFGLVKRRGSR